MFVLDDDVITKETNNVFWKNSKIRANYNIISSANDNVPSKPTNKKQLSSFMIHLSHFALLKYWTFSLQPYF